PRIVPRLDRIRVALGEVLFGAIVVDDMHTPGNNRPHVAGLTAIRADDRLDALRPTPARLQCHPGRFDSTEIDNLDAGLVRSADLIGRTKTLLHHSSHLTPLRVGIHGQRIMPALKPGSQRRTADMARRSSSRFSSLCESA